jgi:glycosyltransferase involved in cell wall biosynthesis
MGNIMVYRIGGPGFLNKLIFPFNAFFLARRLHRANPYSATWSIMASFSGFAALFFKYYSPRTPFILTLQEGDPIDSILRKVSLVSPLFRQIFRRADRIQAISNYLARFAVDMGARAAPMVIPNGVNLALFSSAFSQDEIHKTREEIAIADADTLLVTTSRLVVKNGIEDMIDSLSHLPASIKLLIIGTGPLEGKLKKKAEALGLGSRIVFKGFIQYSDIPRYLAASDIFVRPSLSEGMGNSFIEAMAAGLPVIATPVGGIPDFLRDSETGLFCAVHDPESIARAVRRILENTELRIKISKNGRKEAVQYDWNMVAKSMAKKVFDI